jgi:hypothetical protein
MTAVLIVQMCLTFGNSPLCQIIETVPFKSIEDCATAARLVTKHSGRGVGAMCSARGKSA